MELKSSQLRLGNLVHCFGIQQVVAIKKNEIRVQQELSKGHFSFEWIPISSLSLQGIALSEELLLKYGFVKHNYVENLHKNFRIEYGCTAIYCCINNDEKSFTFRFGNALEQNFDLINCAGITYHYFHQLQNLFFMLTSQELIEVSL